MLRSKSCIVNYINKIDQSSRRDSALGDDVIYPIRFAIVTVLIDLFAASSSSASFAHWRNVDRHPECIVIGTMTQVERAEIEALQLGK